MPGPPLDPFCLKNNASAVLTPSMPRSIFLFRFSSEFSHWMRACARNPVCSVMVNDRIMHQSFCGIRLYDLNRLLCFFSFPCHVNFLLKRFLHNGCGPTPCLHFDCWKLLFPWLSILEHLILIR